MILLGTHTHSHIVFLVPCCSFGSQPFNCSLFHLICRFIEWVGCCCSGSSYTEKNIKHEDVEEEEEERQKMSSICRDEHNKHHIRSLACEALSRFPLFIPLYPGYCYVSSTQTWRLDKYFFLNNTKLLQNLQDSWRSSHLKISQMVG